MYKFKSRVLRCGKKSFTRAELLRPRERPFSALFAFSHAVAYMYLSAGVSAMICRIKPRSASTSPTAQPLPPGASFLPSRRSCRRGCEECTRDCEPRFTANSQYIASIHCAYQHRAAQHSTGSQHRRHGRGVLPKGLAVTLRCRVVIMVVSQQAIVALHDF